jgi:SAM-dependent methyltransferase
VPALSLASLFAEVVGVDPDGAMIEEARRRADEAGLAGKTRWVRARAEDLPAGLGTFTVATFGQSFHWMDRDRVAAVIREMLRPAGVFVQISDLKDEVLPAGDPAPPYEAIRDLVKRYLGPVRRAGQGVLVNGTPSGEAAVLTRAGFTGPERHAVAGGRMLERSAGDVRAWVFSRSDSAPHLFGDRRAEFEADLDRLLRDVSPAGRFFEPQPGTKVMIWRLRTAATPRC